MKFLIPLIILALEAVALADPSPEDLYNEGQAAYDSADYPTAIVKWRASYDLSGEHALLFNIAQAYRLSGDCPNAAATYKRFLTLDPIAHGQDDPPNDQYTLAVDLVRELDQTCGWQMPVRGEDKLSAVARIAHPIAAQRVDEHPGRALRTAGIVTVGAGGVSIAIGLMVGRHASSLAGEVTRACAVSCDWSVQGRKDAAGHRDAVLGYTLDTIGIAAIVGSATMYYLGTRTRAVSISPRAREGGAVVSWSGAW